ncbi:MAG: hypothetical protein AAGI68_06530 [Planctomycetota bacterium]
MGLDGVNPGTEPTGFTLSLVAVAMIFIVGGLWAAFEIFVALIKYQIYLNFDALQILIGAGLFRRSRGWRTCALVVLWIKMISGPIGLALLAFVDGPLEVNLFGKTVGYASKWMAGIALATFWFTLAFWQYWVLTRPNVRQIFGIDGKQGSQLV